MFKYIVCFGSIQLACIIDFSCPGFKYIVCFGSIKSKTFTHLSTTTFKYIVCFGSINFSHFIPFLFLDLNTLYVSVQ